MFQWIPCAWVFPSLQPPQKGREHGLAAPLLDGADDENVLHALGKSYLNASHIAFLRIFLLHFFLL